MRTLMALWLLSVGLFIAAPACADHALKEFAYGLPLPVSGDQAFYELELPLSVYQGSQRNDLGDLRVFNAAGQLVPYALRSPENETRREDIVTTELPFFPLLKKDVSLEDDLSIHVERTTTGTVIDVRADGQEKGSKTDEVGSYLLDASALKSSIDTLELLWASDTPAFLADVVIETSSDLIHWRRLQTAAVARLSYQDYRFDQNKIRLSRGNSRYLRLHWPAGQASPRLSGVRVLTQQHYTIKRPEQNQLDMTAVAAGERRYTVDLLGALPVSAVRIALPDKNSLAAMRLASMESPTGKRSERWRGLVYNLKANGDTLENPAITLSPWRQRYWELTLDDSEVAVGVAPQLEFFWQPDRLTFLAQGDGPFVLAYGNNRFETTRFPLDRLLRISSTTVKPELIQPGEPIPLGGEGSLSLQPPRPWKEYLLWAVLGLGVLLIGGMSFSLYRKLKESEPD